MNTILVPTDFSETAKNAATYAVELAKQLNASRIILYNAYQAPVVTEPTMPVMQIIDIDSLKMISYEGMKHFRSSIQVNENLIIEEICEFAVLPHAIGEVCERVRADVVIMGITGASRVEEALIGSTSISVMKHTKVPVIIIPPDAKCKKITKVMLACDYKKIAETTPIKPIKKILEETHAEFFIVNVNTKLQEEDSSAQDALLSSMFSENNPQLYHLDHEDFIGGINDFAEENTIDMIITIPKKHGMFEGLFRESHTKQLAFHSHVPLMCIHEEEHH